MIQDIFDWSNVFLETRIRNPLRCRIKEHDLLNWMIISRKKMNAGELKEERLERFMKLLELVERDKRVNQFQ